MKTSPRWAVHDSRSILKRVIDIVGSAIGIAVLLPLLAIIGFLVRLDSPGPVLYPAERVGKRGRYFAMYKFRTMFHDVPGPGCSYNGDPRVTRLGKILRRAKLDELPQLINVLRGDMSLVGPRPESPSFVSAFSREHKKILEMAPGITGKAQIAFVDESDMLVGSDVEELEFGYSAHLLPSKLDLDMKYVKRRSLLLDGRILAETVKVVLFSQR